MNQEIKKLWVEALRSGEYKQTSGELRDSDGFCCLGVLCDIYKKEELEGEWAASDGTDAQIFITSHDRSSQFLPSEVMHWSGLPVNPSVFDDDTLADLNDSGADFALIAAIIETEL